MKNFPLVPAFMICLMAILYFVGLQKGKENQPVIDHGLAASVDKHLSIANKSFDSNHLFNFERELGQSIQLLAAITTCGTCMESDVKLAQSAIEDLVNLKKRIGDDKITPEQVKFVISHIVNSFAKNHLLYDENHLDNDTEYFAKDALAHLKYLGEFSEGSLLTKEEETSDYLKEAINKHEVENDQTKKALHDIAESIE